MGLRVGGRAVQKRSFLCRSGRKFVWAVAASLLGCSLSVETARAADTKPGWQAAWENTVAAAKKEGRLNFYVGRYGSEPLLNEFRKEFPEIKIFSTNGTGNSLGTRIVAEARAGDVLADLYSGGAATNFEILYKGTVLGSLKSALILPETMSLIKGGPHPNAAKVFINWFLSRRGQIALQKYEDLYRQEPPNSRRIDIPKDMLPASSRLVDGRRYFDFTDPKYSDMTPIYHLAKEFMKGREDK